MKITKTMDKKYLTSVLAANVNNTEGVEKSLLDSLAYTLANAAKATRADLATLVKDLSAALGDKFIIPAMAETKPTAPVAKKTPDPKPENLVKKTSGKKTDAKPEAKKTTETTGEEPKKPSKKGADTKSVDNRVVPLATSKVFPDTIEYAGETYTRIDGELTVKDLADAPEGTIEFAFWWTKRHLRQFPYFNNDLGHPKSFPNDLDMAQLIYVDEDDYKVAYCISDATKAPYTILPADLKVADDEGVRIGATSHIEFAVYQKSDETSDEDETDEGEDE